tara:strand:- start:1075 stop:1818 length:744 start_codon:yes stop_codon:yes gene_type:complete
MKTKYKIVSLGGGCDIKLFMINPLLPHYKTEFFDWLWNFDGGLVTVKKIIEDDFSWFSEAEDYYWGLHPKFESKLKLDNSSNKVSLKFDEKDTYYNIPIKYPEVIFMHYPDTEEISNTYPERIKRFKKLLKRRNVFFVYYRQFDEPINSEYSNNKDYDLEKKLKFWQNESIEFIKYINSFNPNIKLLSLFALPIDFKIENISKFNLLEDSNKNLFFDFLFYKNIPAEDQIAPGKEEMRRMFNKHLKS